jgi:hypothetical protein
MLVAVVLVVAMTATTTACRGELQLDVGTRTWWGSDIYHPHKIMIFSHMRGRKVLYLYTTRSQFTTVDQIKKCSFN